MNVLDRVVGYFSPSAGFKRERAREAMHQVRAYAGARDNRGRDGWRAAGTGANAEIGSSMVKLRNRVRQLVRDDGLAKRIVDLWALHLIGDGITLDFTGPGGAKKASKFDLWAGSTQCDADGHLDFYGLQNLAARIMVEAGSSFIVKRIRSPKNYPHLVVPLQLQVLEPDFLDHTKNGTSERGNPIIQGIEYYKDRPSTRAFYWMFTEHPGETRTAIRSPIQSVPVPAENVIHMFRKERSQNHGVTWLHAVVNRIKDLDDYIEALMMKAKIEACFTIVIEEDTDGVTPPGTTPRASESEFELEPGLVRRMRKGDKAHAFDPSSSQSHGILLPAFIRLIASGVGLTYDQASSDLTGANYSSLRAGKMEFNQTVSQLQWNVIAPPIETVAKWFVEAGVYVKLWRTEEHTVEITMPKTQFVDPKKDGDAEIQDMGAGLSTWGERVRARGNNPRKHIKALKTEIDVFEQEGLVHPFSQMKKSEPAKPGTPKAPPEDDKDEAA